MRISTAFALLGLLAATAAQALPSDAKTLAQFDLGYAKCEARFPEMRGHRDEAYLALWKTQADAKASTELDKVRKTSKYQKERQLAYKAMAKGASPELDAKLKQQCDATWAEAKRNGPAAKP